MRGDRLTGGIPKDRDSAQLRMAGRGPDPAPVEAVVHHCMDNRLLARPNAASPAARAPLGFVSPATAHAQRD